MNKRNNHTITRTVRCVVDVEVEIEFAAHAGCRGTYWQPEEPAEVEIESIRAIKPVFIVLGDEVTLVDEEDQLEELENSALKELADYKDAAYESAMEEQAEAREEARRDR